jgi:hypothetical protein
MQHSDWWFFIEVARQYWRLQLPLDDKIWTTSTWLEKPESLSKSKSPEFLSDHPIGSCVHFLIKNLDLQPMAFGFCLLQQNLPAVLLPHRSVVSGTKCHSGPDVISRRIWISFRESGAEALNILKPCDSIAERTFPVSSIYWVSWTEVHSLRLRLFWCAVPKVWKKRIVFQLSNLFRFHIFGPNYPYQSWLLSW